MKKILAEIYAVLYKELKSEFRTRYSISAVFLFILTTITVFLFGIANEVIESYISAAILWIIFFFASMTSLAKVFVSEEERGTVLLLQINASSGSIYFGKLLFNILLALAVNIFATLLYLLFNNKVEIQDTGVFIGVLILGSLGLAAASTIISALIAKANTKNALFPVLSFPILLPLIMTAIDLTKYALDISSYTYSPNSFGIMIAYSGLLITVSYYLFEIIWRE